MITHVDDSARLTTVSFLLDFRPFLVPFLHLYVISGSKKRVKKAVPLQKVLALPVEVRGSEYRVHRTYSGKMSSTESDSSFAESSSSDSGDTVAQVAEATEEEESSSEGEEFDKETELSRKSQYKVYRKSKLFRTRRRSSSGASSTRTRSPGWARSARTS